MLVIMVGVGVCEVVVDRVEDVVLKLVLVVVEAVLDVPLFVDISNLPIVL